MLSANLSTILLWIAFVLCILSVIPRVGAPLWAAVLLVILALLIRQS
jgi:hypothetical protein